MKLDKEYSTMFLQEKDYLESLDIKPTFVKRIEGVRIYKYEKTYELFLALSEFYKN